MIDGEVRARAGLTSGKGHPTPVRVVAARPTTANVRLLEQTSELWLEQSEAAEELMREDPAFRAFFAADTAFLAARYLTDERCCVIAAEDEATGELLGAAVYSPDGGEWWILDFAVSPRNQPAFPAQDQVRGIGTMMLGVIAEDIDRDPGCKRVSLYPLDEQAREFWLRRGFHNGIAPYHLTCEEVHALAERNRQAGPDAPDRGEAVSAGHLDAHTRAATPRVLGRVYANQA